MKDKPLSIIITCEHGGNVFPKQFSALFHDRKELLKSHRGHDPGALDLAKKLAQGLKAPLFFSETTRLLIDQPEASFRKPQNMALPSAIDTENFAHDHMHKGQSILAIARAKAQRPQRNPSTHIETLINLGYGVCLNNFLF